MRLPTLHRPLAAPGFAMVRLMQWAMTVVSVVSIVVTGWVWWESEIAAGQAIQYETAAARLEEANRLFVRASLQAGFDLSDSQRAILNKKVSFARQVTEQQAFSWTLFLTALEETVPPRVSLNSVALAPKDATISLSGSALALTDVTAFVNALDSHRAFRNVVLSQHRVQESAQGIEPKTRSRPTVEFTLTVTYRPPVPL